MSEISTTSARTLNCQDEVGLCPFDLQNYCHQGVWTGHQRDSQREDGNIPIG